MFIDKPDFARTNHKLRACLMKRPAKRNQSCHSAASTRIPSPLRPQDRPLQCAAEIQLAHVRLPNSYIEPSTRSVSLAPCIIPPTALQILTTAAPQLL